MFSLRKPIGYALLFAALITACSWFKINFICGLQTGSFSFTSSLVPLVGFFGGTLGAVILFFFRTLLKTTTGTTTNILLACHIPTLFAGLYCAIFSTKNPHVLKKYFAALLPLICITAFCLHPVGGQACVYSLFWLIPIACALTPHRNLFFHALGSTFTAHAVGSVMWLYLGLIPNPLVWISLIPVVICERLLFSCGMVLCYRTITYARTGLTKRFARTLSTQTNSSTI